MAFSSDEQRREYYRRYRANNPEKHHEWRKTARNKRTPEEVAEHNAVVKTWREKNKDYVRAYKRQKYHETYERVQTLKAERGCATCGEKHPATLDFHHTSDDKEKAVSQMINKCGWDKLKAEIDKCIVLCSNCHRKHHWDINTAGKRVLTAHELDKLAEPDGRKVG